MSCGPISHSLNEMRHSSFLLSKQLIVFGMGYCASLASSSDHEVSSVEHFHKKREAIVKRLKLHQKRVTNASLQLARLDHAPSRVLGHNARKVKR